MIFSTNTALGPPLRLNGSARRSVFVGQDRETNEVVALKRINTEQEENGFPITAIREVKILKALTHPNIVNLKEIVTSKGASQLRSFVCRFAVCY
jgi:serine/threonine protein kinase